MRGSPRVSCTNGFAASFCPTESLPFRDLGGSGNPKPNAPVGPADPKAAKTSNGGYVKSYYYSPP